MSGIFITGTDTGVGKTVVAAGTLRWLRQHGIDAVPMKPVQTGGRPGAGGLTSPDLEFCLAASGLRPGGEESRLMLPYVYGAACSPHLAGRLAGRYPEISRIKDCVDRLLEGHQAVVAEGAGGIMVPLNESQTMLDLMVALGYPVVLVSRSGLGTINHTLLSIRALRAVGIRLIGVVFNQVSEAGPGEGFIEADNPKAVAQFGDVRILGKIRYLSSLGPEKARVWGLFEKDMSGLEDILNELGGSRG